MSTTPAPDFRNPGKPDFRGDKVPAMQPHYKHAGIALRLQKESDERQAALSVFYANQRARITKAKRSAKRPRKAVAA